MTIETLLFVMFVDRPIVDLAFPEERCIVDMMFEQSENVAIAVVIMTSIYKPNSGVQYCSQLIF